MNRDESHLQRLRARGQTEPLAALVAVALFCVALSVYAGFLTGLLPELGSDRELAEVTGERVWEVVSENGIYPAGTNLSSVLDADVFPHGRRVSVNVTYVHRGTLTTASQASFDTTGESVGAVTSNGETFRRPIPVQRQSGDVRPGMLTVVVSNVR
ncbi:hypothetical protein SAMN05216226_10152 [Halovenus aranensis]|uniref:Uncharacterized protein n=1 Tax=Halovenus aranensis TaxID=890420 RepID=A0A1G8RQE0_9EURY|nr:hypothetical protein [Halovenus aranensis]SDJ19119.1 hypothetical protein SAMN05216226_10152 [Halovenus aranensis]